jgi:hypothetical protein
MTVMFMELPNEVSQTTIPVLELGAKEPATRQCSSAPG